MITVKVSTDKISIIGHANYADYGKDIVCAAVSSVVITSVEGISILDENAIELIQEAGNITINIIRHSQITDKLVTNMINCLKEIENKYPKNIKIINREE